MRDLAVAFELLRNSAQTPPQRFAFGEGVREHTCALLGNSAQGSP